MKSEEESKLNLHSKRISRRKAVKNIGKYAAVTALGTFLILNPLKAQAESLPDGPGGGFGR
jgi:hypothetical protein